MTPPRRGFTLIEAVVAIAVTAFVAVAAATLQRDLVRTDAVLRSSLSAQQEVRKAFKDFTAAARIATNASTGAYPLAATSATTFTFYADVNNDGLVERYRYFMDGTNLRRGVLVPTTVSGTLTYVTANEVLSTVISEVSNGSTPIFEYYNASYDGTGNALTQPVTPSVVRMVKITVITDRNGSRSPGPQTYTTQVMLRTLKDNL